MRRSTVTLSLTLSVGIFSLFAQTPAPAPLRQINDSFVRWSAELTPSIVLIRSESFVPVKGATGYSAPAQGTGSGVLLSADGYIVTNRHVVGRSSIVDVHLPPARPKPGESILPRPTRKYEGRVLGTDAETDIAVVKIDVNDAPHLKLGDSDLLRQGQLVLALGNPLGLENSVTQGIVSAVARQLEPDSRVIYIQTDAPINPGNSGGALVDIDGNVIGINTLIMSQSGGSEGVGFAVPSRIVQVVVDQIKEHGKVIRGDIGVTGQTITPEIATGLSLARDYGVVVADVEPKGAGDNAGVKVGDIVLAIDGKPLENARQFHVNLYQKRVASLIKLDILRGKQEQTIEVVVLDRTEKSTKVSLSSDPKDHVFRKLHILGVEIDEKMLKDLPPTRFTYGILIAGLLPGLGSPNGLLEPGDILYSINTKPVSTLPDLRKMLADFKSGDVLVLQVEREGKLRYIEYPLE